MLNLNATRRELEVLRLSARAYSNKEIADALDISIKTVECHKTNAVKSLDLNGRRAVLHFAREQGWLADV